MAAGTGPWLPRLGTAELVGHLSIFVNGLIIVYLCIQFLKTNHSGVSPKKFRGLGDTEARPAPPPPQKTEQTQAA